MITMDSIKTFTGPGDGLISWLNSVDVFLLDCDGVIWRGGNQIPGVSNTINLLRKLGKDVYFVTNNSTKTRNDNVQKLKKIMGIACEEDNVLSSAYATSLYCKQQGFKKVYVIGEPGLHAELAANAGVETVGLDDHKKEFNFGSITEADIPDDVDAVVVGFDRYFCYYKLAMASAYLRKVKSPPVQFVATNTDSTFPDSGMLLPGGGSIVACVSVGSGRETDMVVGKPNTSFLDILSKMISVDRKRLCMVGDRLNTDILFGNSGGLGSTLLVLSGVTKKEDLNQYQQGDNNLPTHLVDDFGILGTWIEQSLQ